MHGIGRIRFRGNVCLSPRTEFAIHGNNIIDRGLGRCSLRQTDRSSDTHGLYASSGPNNEAAARHEGVESSHRTRTKVLDFQRRSDRAETRLKTRLSDCAAAADDQT